MGNSDLMDCLARVWSSNLSSLYTWIVYRRTTKHGRTSCGDYNLIEDALWVVPLGLLKWQRRTRNASSLRTKFALGWFYGTSPVGTKPGLAHADGLAFSGLSKSKSKWRMPPACGPNFRLLRSMGFRVESRIAGYGSSDTECFPLDTTWQRPTLCLLLVDQRNSY